MKRVLLDENNIVINIIECNEDLLSGTYEWFSWLNIGDAYTTTDVRLNVLDNKSLNNANSITNLELALCEQYENGDKQLTDLQLALCEVYESLQGGTTNG